MKQLGQCVLLLCGKFGSFAGELEHGPCCSHDRMIYSNAIEGMRVVRSGTPTR